MKEENRIVTEGKMKIALLVAVVMEAAGLVAVLINIQ
jgi:cell division protein FtsL